MIPKIIWQTYECDYKDLPTKTLECAKSWQEKNSDWEYEYVSGKQREQFVLNNFGDNWYKIYISYKHNILKANLWRYLCLYTYGGFYVDSDMFCKEPITKWLNTEYDFIAFQDPPYDGYTESFFASSSKNIFLENLLKNINKQYFLNKEYKTYIDYIINEVGYVIFTKSILETIKNVNDYNYILHNQEFSKIIHSNFITHYKASNNDNNSFGSDYLSWKKHNLKEFKNV